MSSAASSLPDTGGTMNGITVATWLSVAGIYLTGAGLSYALFSGGPGRWPVGVTSGVLTVLIWLAIHGHSRGWWEKDAV